MHLHVGAVRVSGPPGGNHLQHAGRRPAVGLLPLEFQHQKVSDVLLGHQQERVRLVAHNFFLPARRQHETLRNISKGSLAEETEPHSQFQLQVFSFSFGAVQRGGERGLHLRAVHLAGEVDLQLIVVN